VAIPRLSGHLLLILVSMKRIVMRCCSTCLANITSPTDEHKMRYSAADNRDLLMVSMSYVFMVSHLMVKTTADHPLVQLVMESLKKVVRTLLLTKKVKDSQLLNLKFGQSKKWNNDHSEKHRHFIYSYLNI
jgi:hypothetical protein